MAEFWTHWHRRLAVPLRWFGWFVCGQAVAAAAISLHYFASGDLPVEPLAIVYLLISRIGHFMLLSLLLNLLLILPPLMIWPNRFLPRLWGTLCNTLGLTVLLADTFVYQQYRFHLNGAVLDLLLNGGGQVIAFSLRMELMIAIVVAILAALAGLITWVVQRWHQRWRYGRRITLATLVCLLGANLLNTWAMAVDYGPITRQAGQLPLYYPLSANRLMLKLGLINPQDLQNRRVKVSPEQSPFHYPLAPLHCETPAEPLNLVILLVDALRYDTLTPEVMPQLSAFAQQNWQFQYHVSAANGTRAGVFGLFYGLPPSYWRAALTSHQPAALLSALQQAQYQLGIFGSAPLTKPEFNETVFATVPNLRLTTPGATSAQRDLRVMEDWQAWLDHRAADRPFFSFLFFDAIHGYSVPEGYEGPFQPVWEEINQMELGPDFDKTPYLNRYKNAAHFADSQVGAVLARLQAEGELERTVVIITADHGEEFNDNGLNYWGHNGNFTQVQTHVPMILHWPGTQPKQHQGLTSHYDITATLLPHLLGCRNPTSDYSIGEDLFKLPDHNAVIMGSYIENALFQPDRITLIDNTGRLSVRDARYRELSKDQVPRPQLMQMLETMRRYYRR